MKKLQRNSLHSKGRSHDCLLLEHNGKKIKMTYEAYNASEQCSVEIFDGFKFNHAFSLRDLGVTPESSAYLIWDEKKREARATDLFSKAEKMCKLLLG